MHCLSGDESPRSSPVPDIHVNSKEIQKKVKQIQKQTTQITIVEELLNHAKTYPTLRRYSHRLMTISLRIFFASTIAYEILSYFLPLPCIRTMFYKQKELLSDFQAQLTDITKVAQIAQEYSKNWTLNEPVILAVDACSVNPTVSIFSNGTVKGLIHEYQMDSDLLTQASNTISVFEKWMVNVSKMIVDSYFVYQVQPLSPNLNSFILHIETSKSGKANISTLLMLKKLARILQSVNITVVSFASDGDNFASSSHDYNIKIHYNNFQYNLSPHKTEPLFLSDPLHILKRVRYHFIPLITNQSQIRSILNLQAMVFRNDRASKMHDKLPLLLFQLKHYEQLRINKFFNYSIFILPYSLLLSSLSYNLNFDDRILFLNMARILLEKSHFPVHFTSFQNHIIFKPKIIRDCLSTVLTILDIINLPNLTNVHLNRFGTNPLEHTFGIIRMRSKDHHNSERFIKEAEKVNSLKKINEELILENIKNRELQFGRVISIPTQKNNKYQNANNYIDSLFNEAITGQCNDLCYKIHALFNEVINDKIGPNNKCYLLQSKDICLAPNSNILIEKRQNSANSLSPKCRWNNEETSLLIRLNQDLNGNISLISQYFPKRTIKSIQEKLHKIKGVKKK